jgi:triphosphatase
LRELAAVTAGIDPAWEAPLADAFRSLGSHRDRSHLERTVEPLIRDAGGPAVAATAPAAGDPGPVDAVRAPAFQDSLFCLLAFAQSETAAPSPDHRETRRKLGSALARLHRQVLRDGARFAALDDARQHRVRKRAKRLRYLSEFAAPLFGSRLTQRFAHALTPVQDALGWYNDEVTALRAYRSIVTTQPQAWFAAGWLSARRENNALLCQRAMGQFARVPPFWE